MSKKERFTELLTSLKTQAFKENNINPIDVTAMQFGITPMVVYRKLDSKRDQEDNLSCELYLDKIFIASGLKFTFFSHISSPLGLIESMIGFNSETRKSQASFQIILSYARLAEHKI